MPIGGMKILAAEDMVYLPVRILIQILRMPGIHGSLTEDTIREIESVEAEGHPAGYYYIVDGIHRIFEAINFYTTLRIAGFSAILSGGKEIMARFDGTDYVGIVSHYSNWRDCEKIIPESYGPIIDFMTVYKEDMENYGDQIEWIPEEPVHLLLQK